jgi:DNA primase
MAKAEDLGIEDVYEVVTGIFGLNGDVSKGQFRTLCPVHELGETGHKPSVDVHLVTGYWNCFSCPAAGDIIDLGVVALGDVPFEERIKKDKMTKRWLAARGKIHKLLQPDDPNAITASIQRRLRTARATVKESSGTKASFEPMIPSLDAYEFRYPRFLKDRGFSKKTLKRWNIRYAVEATLFKEDGKTFTITNAVAIPIFDHDGELVGWCYRATEKSESWFQNVRYIYTPGITDVLSHLWFGMHLQKPSKEITVCEGALDAIWCDQNKIPAVAILGSQVKQLPKTRALMDFRRVVLFTDRDLAGTTTAYHLGNALQERGVGVSVCRYQSWMMRRTLDAEGNPVPAKDAQDLCPLDIELVHLRAIPFMTWKLTS